jgi:hypothetical protein
MKIIKCGITEKIGGSIFFVCFAPRMVLFVKPSGRLTARLASA